PWKAEETRRLCREVTRQSIVLLKHTPGVLPLCTAPHADGKLRSIALIGPLADRVHIDWYGGTPPYLVTPLEGIKQRAGEKVRVESVTHNDISAVIRAAKRADVCLVCVGNHPTGDDKWAQVTRKSYGKEAVDRQSLELEAERLVQHVFEVN